MNPTPIPPTQPAGFTGYRFALLSQVARVTDAELERIQIAGTLLLADVARDYRLATSAIRVVSDPKELAEDEILATFAEHLDDPSAAAYHTLLADGRPAILIGAGAGTTPADWEGDAGHELVETVLDADCSSYKEEIRADGTVRLHAFEGCDRCQGQSRGLDVGRGAPVIIPNVLFTGYWKMRPAVGEKLDLFGLVKNSFELQENSYGIYVLAAGPEQQEASGNLAAKRLSVLPPNLFPGLDQLFPSPTPTHIDPAALVEPKGRVGIEANGTLRQKILASAARDLVQLAGSPPSHKLVNPNGRLQRRLRDAHALVRGT